MATVTLQYNTRNPKALSWLSSIRESGVFKVKESVKPSEKQPKKALGDFLGLLSEDEYLQLKKDTQQARKEWNVIETHWASEYVLAKDWLNSKEDEAWKDL